MIKIIPGSHLDHGVSAEALAYLLDQVGETSGTFIAKVFDVPAEILPVGLRLDLYGPAEGDAPVPETEVVYVRRGDRSGLSRCVDRPSRTTRKVVVIAGPAAGVEGNDIALYTCYGGSSVAPREPWSLPEGSPERAEAEAWWSKHALVPPASAGA